MKKYNITKDFLIKEYTQNKKPISQISKKIGCSDIVIRNRLLKYNIPIRTISEAMKGKKNSYIDGRYSKNYYCKEPNCNNKICYWNWLYGNRRCGSCAIKKRYKDNPNSIETKSKMSLSKGGTGIPYENNEYPEEYFKIRYWILKRDNHTCQNCFEYGNEVHHIDYNKDNNKESNLITLCHKCNMKANKNRNYYYAYFKYIVDTLK